MGDYGWQTVDEERTGMSFLTDMFGALYEEIAAKEKKEREQKKRVDRIAREAERKQRFQKGMKWK